MRVGQENLRNLPEGNEGFVITRAERRRVDHQKSPVAHERMAVEVEPLLPRPPAPLVDSGYDFPHMPLPSLSRLRNSDDIRAPLSMFTRLLRQDTRCRPATR